MDGGQVDGQKLAIGACSIGSSGAERLGCLSPAECASLPLPALSGGVEGLRDADAPD